MGSMYVGAIIAVQSHFTDSRALVQGIIMSAHGLAQFMWAPLVEWLLQVSTKLFHARPWHMGLLCLIMALRSSCGHCWGSGYCRLVPSYFTHMGNMGALCLLMDDHWLLHVLYDEV